MLVKEIQSGNRKVMIFRNEDRSKRVSKDGNKKWYNYSFTVLFVEEMFHQWVIDERIKPEKEDITSLKKANVKAKQYLNLKF